MGIAFRRADDLASPFAKNPWNLCSAAHGCREIPPILPSGETRKGQSLGRIAALVLLVVLPNGRRIRNLARMTEVVSNLQLQNDETSDFSFQFELYSVPPVALCFVKSGICASHEPVPLGRLGPAKSCNSKASSCSDGVFP